MVEVHGEPRWLPTYRHYVSNIYIIAYSRDEANGLNRIINNLKPSIRVSVEHENVDHLPFLDVLIKCNNNGSV